MATVKVYQFDYFDTLLKRDRRSIDFATADAIAAMRGTILAETMREVDEELLDDNGTIRAAKLPPRPVAEPRWRTPPGETRIGAG